MNLVEKYNGREKEKMGLSKKYKKEFLKSLIETDKNRLLKVLIETELSTGKSFAEWKTVEIKDYLQGFRTTSQNSLNKYIAVLRKFADFVTEREGTDRIIYNTDDIDYAECIDLDKLKTVLISEDQFKHIRNQLTLANRDGEESNFRDRLLFSLAWAGLKPEEVKKLQEKDIEFIFSDKFGHKVAMIDTGKRIIKIEDKETVEDIVKTLQETSYTVIDKNGNYKKLSYRDSNYLIKPVSVGRTADEGWVSNPSLSMQGKFKSLGITCPGIDVPSLSMEDINRSKVIELLLNEEVYDMGMVMALYGIKHENSVKWLVDLAARLKRESYR